MYSKLSEIRLSSLFFLWAVIALCDYIHTFLCFLQAPKRYGWRLLNEKVEIIIRILVGIIPLISLFGLLFFYIDLMNILIDNGILQRKISFMQ